MLEIDEGQLRFFFPDNTLASKYDDWSFYRNQFSKAFDGIKAMDFIHVDNGHTWLIEVKDYRVNRRTKPIDIGDEIAFKVRDTLAGLVAAKFNATDPQEQTIAEKALSKNRLRIILHLEQPKKQSKLFPKAIDPSKVKQKLKQRLKSIDPHPRVVDKSDLETWDDMNWSVKGI